MPTANAVSRMRRGPLERSIILDSVNFRPVIIVAGELMCDSDISRQGAGDLGQSPLGLGCSPTILRLALQFALLRSETVSVCASSRL